MVTSSLDVSALGIGFSDHHVIVAPDGSRYAVQRLPGETSPGTKLGDAPQECKKPDSHCQDSDGHEKEGHGLSCLGGRPTGPSDTRAAASDLRAPGTEDRSFSLGSRTTTRLVSDPSDEKSTNTTIASPDPQSQSRSPFASFSTYASFGPIVSSPVPETNTCEELERHSAPATDFHLLLLSIRLRSRTPPKTLPFWFHRSDNRTNFQSFMRDSRKISGCG